MSYTLGEAAKATGFSKPTLSRAIKKGKLSAKRLEDRSYSIDPAELDRWKDANGHRNGSVKRTETLPETPEFSAKNSDLQAEVEALRERIKAGEMERNFLEQRVEDLKERVERAERKEDQLHALLSDLRPKAPEGRRKGFFARLLG